MSLFVFRILSLSLVYWKESEIVLELRSTIFRVTRSAGKSKKGGKINDLFLWGEFFCSLLFPLELVKKKKKRERAYARARNIGYSFYSFNETWKLNKLKGEAKSRGEKWPCVCVRAIFYLFVFNYLPWNCNWYLSYYCLNNIKKRKGKKIEQHGTNESKNIFIFSMLQLGCIYHFNPALKRKRFLSIV